MFKRLARAFHDMRTIKALCLGVERHANAEGQQAVGLEHGAAARALKAMGIDRHALASAAKQATI